MVTAAAQGADDEPTSQVRRRRSWAAAVRWRSRRLV